MPAYSFSYIEFVFMILEGRKPHTIRPRRKNRTKVGDMLTLYYKQRTPSCHVICLTQCIKVTPMVIYPRGMLTKINGRVLSISATVKLAKKDGFNGLPDFFRFFERYDPDQVNDLELVEWDPKKKVNLWNMAQDYFTEWIQPMNARERLAWLEDMNANVTKGRLTQEEWLKEYLNEWPTEVSDG